jgi:hemerythrin-like domain-containing protein
VEKKIRFYETEDGIDMSAFSRFRSFEILDSCHVKIQSHLDELAILFDQIAKGDSDADVRKKADAIEVFFSTTARNHHAMEEDEVFPSLLISDNTETVAKVRDLIEDHFWIEKYWIDLAPMLKAFSIGAEVPDMEKLSKTIKLFHDLSSYHIECEESMIYPEAKAVMNSMQARDGTS